MRRETKEMNMDKKDVSICNCFDRSDRMINIFILYMLYVVLKAIQKLRDNNIYPTSLELLRVNLAATVFSPEVQDLLQQFKDDVKRALRLKNTDPLSTYMSHFWELLQLNNSVQ